MSLGAFHRIAEERIRDARERGLLDGPNPFKGRPLPRDDGAAEVPADVRAAYRVLKNAGFLPEELELKKSILRIEDLIRACTDQAEGIRLRRRLNAKVLRYELLMERRGRGVAPSCLPYQRRILQRLGG